MRPVFCVRACRSLGGVLRSRGEITIGITLDHSTPLPFPAQFACALFVLDIADDGAKAHLTGKAKPESLQRRRGKSPEALLAKVLGGVAWMELHAVQPVAGKLRKTRLRSIGPPLLHASADTVVSGR